MEAQAIELTPQASECSLASSEREEHREAEWVDEQQDSSEEFVKEAREPVAIELTPEVSEASSASSEPEEQEAEWVDEQQEEAAEWVDGPQEAEWLDEQQEAPPPPPPPPPFPRELQRESAFEALLDESLQHDADSATLLVRNLLAWLFSVVIAAFGGSEVVTSRIRNKHPAWWLFLTVPTRLSPGSPLPKRQSLRRTRLVEVDVGDMPMGLTPS